MRILIAIDGSDVSRRALKAVAPIARSVEQPEVWVLTVVDPNEVSASPTAEAPLDARSLTSERGGGGAPSISAVVEHLGAERRVAETRTQAIGRVEAEREVVLSHLAEAELTGLNVRLHVELAHDPGLAILDFADEQEIELIAMGTHGRSGLAHLLAGSVAERVIRGATVRCWWWGPNAISRPSRGPDAPPPTR